MFMEKRRPRIAKMILIDENNRWGFNYYKDMRYLINILYIKIYNLENSDSVELAPPMRWVG